jgi:DNA-binding transcriptional ArsR family regulator
VYYNPDEYTKEKYDTRYLELGISGNKAVEEAYRLCKSYIDAFSQKAVAPDEDRLFFSKLSDGTSLHYLLGLALDQNEQWGENLSAASEDKIYSALSMILFEKVPQSFSDVFELLQEMKIEPEQAWQIMAMLKNPKEYFERFMRLISSNEPAYRFAMDAIKAEMEPLLENFETSCEQLIELDKKSGSPLLAGSLLLNDSEMTIIPTVLTGLIFSARSVYVGLYLPETYKLMGRSGDHEIDLVPILKALGDSSKFEILKILRQGPKYSLELAKHLDITPATASHHMNALLSMGLVTVEKSGKKTNYTLNSAKLKAVAESLGEIFELS